MFNGNANNLSHVDIAISITSILVADSVITAMVQLIPPLLAECDAKALVAPPVVTITYGAEEDSPAGNVTTCVFTVCGVMLSTQTLLRRTF